MKISASLNTARLNATVSWFSEGSGVPVAEIYDGEQPSFGGEATGNLLVTISLPLPIGSVIDNTIAMTASEMALIVASGVPVWARIKNANGEHAWDCPVALESDEESTAPLRLSQMLLYAGGFVALTSGVLG